jgi:hypothetical protein
VHLSSGRILRGTVIAWTKDYEMVDRELALGQPLSVAEPNGAVNTINGQCVVVRGAVIEYITTAVARTNVAAAVQPVDRTATEDSAEPPPSHPNTTQSPV